MKAPAAGTPKKHAVKISPARKRAFTILQQLAASPQLHSDDLLQSPEVEKLSLQDRHLCTTLVMGVLRWQLWLDQEIHALLTRNSKLDDPVRIALRLGAFQLLLLDRIPAHAAISEAVEMSRQAGHNFASRMVNAVLRKLSTSGPSQTAASDAERAHPEWMLTRWRHAFGEVAAAALCAYHQQPPPVSLHIFDTQAEEALLREGAVLAPGTLLTSSRRVVSGDVLQSEACKPSRLQSQDEGSQLIAELLGATHFEPKSILDCCAAPGNKTALLATRHPQARVLALDLSTHRLTKMQARFHLSPTLRHIECSTADASSLERTEAFDLVLCDAPCSGTGTLAHNPEIKLRLQPEDLLRHQIKQVSILKGALGQLGPGGRLVYSTCSLEPEENEQVVAQALAAVPGIRLLPVEARIRDLLSLGILHPSGAQRLLSQCLHGDYLRIVPGVLACDGFFAAIFTRASPTAPQ